MTSNASQSIPDINSIATDLGNKTDVDLLNLSDTGKIVGGGG